MTLLTNATPLLWLIASAGAFFLVFRPKADWPIVATPIRALSVFVLVFIGGAMLTAVTPRCPGEMCTSMIVSVLLVWSWPACRTNCWCAISVRSSVA